MEGYLGRSEMLGNCVVSPDFTQWAPRGVACAVGGFVSNDSLTTPGGRSPIRTVRHSGFRRPRQAYAVGISEPAE